MKDIAIPKTYNYIAAFLTFRCNYKCSYCINYFEIKKLPKGEMSGKDWVKGINRIVLRDDLPITLQGGEPTVHKDFFYIVNHIKPELNIDILTNLQGDVDEFIRNVDPKRVKRRAHYASIRVSYHPEVMDLEETIQKTSKMLEAKFSIGIWGVLHPSQKDEILRAQSKCKKLGIDFRTKEFLGEYRGRLYGTYLYEGACDKKRSERVLCKTTELIISSNGNIYRCHSDLYANRKPIGHLLDPNFKIEDKFRECNYYGHCNPCDIKIKTNRFQQFGHTSVKIKRTA